MESLNRLLNVSHLLQGKVIGLVGDTNPDISDIGAVGDLIDQCRQLYEDYVAEVKALPMYADNYDDPNRTALISDDEAPDTDPNRTVIIESDGIVGDVAEKEVTIHDETDVVEIPSQPETEPVDQEIPADSVVETIEEAADLAVLAESAQVQLQEMSVGMPCSADECKVEKDEQTVINEEAVESDEYISLDDLSAVDSVENGGIRVDEMLQRRVANDIRRAFTLNDKYRFRRELFGNSDAALNDALDVVSAMRSYDEARDYFASDLGWDLENEDVKDFLDVIASHFK